MLYSEHANKYYTSGYGVIPCNGKAPAVSGWSDYCKDTPISLDLVKKWSIEHPNKNIGLPLGEQSNLYCVDLDSDDPKIITILEDCLPKTDYIKRGRVGKSYFFRPSNCLIDSKNKVKNIKFSNEHSHRDGKLDGVDFLFDGRQTIMPPSNHPDGGSYVWIDKSFLDNGFSEYNLPELAFWMVEKLVKELDPYCGSSKNSFSGGRNDNLKEYIATTLANRRLSDDIAATELMKWDILKHSDNPLFSDSSEKSNHYDDAIDNALRFYKSVMTSINNQRKRKGEKPLVPLDTKESGEVRFDDIPLHERDIKFPFYSTAFWSKGKKDNYIFEQQHFNDYMKAKYNVIAENKGCYVYNGKHYTRQNFELTKTLITKEMRELRAPVNRAIENSFVEHCSKSLLNAYRIDRFDPTSGYLNLSNGLLNIETLEFMPHTPKVLTLGVLPYRYDPSQKCPRWKWFLDQTFNSEEEIDYLKKWMAYVLHGGRPYNEIALFLYGDGQNGKSTVTRMIKGMLGALNYSSISIGELGSSYNTAKLRGMLANIPDEAPAKKHLDSELFKSIVTGSEITVRNIYEAPITTTLGARIIAPTNSIIKTEGDSSYGIERRIHYLNFSNKVKKKDRELWDDLDRELSGVLNWVLEVFRSDEFKEAGKVIIEDMPPSSDSIMEEHRLENDSIFNWAKSLEKSEAISQVYTTKDCYSDYKVFCSWSNKKPKSWPQFRRTCKGILASVHGDSIRNDSDKTRPKITGIKLTGSFGSSLKY